MRTNTPPPKPRQPKTAAEIMRAFGNLRAAATALGVTIGVAAEMYADGIPYRFHQRAIDAAEKLGIPGVTSALLVKTYTKPQTAKAIITALGGRVEVASILGTTKNAVSNWYMAGFPPKYHRRLVEAAEKLGIPDVTMELLERTHQIGTPPRPRRTTYHRRCKSCGCTIVETGAAPESLEQHAA